jgi:hypothetical protein
LKNREKLFLKAESTIQARKENEERPINSKTELLTLESGLEDLGTATEHKFGQMVQNMKVNGRTTELMDKVFSGT